MLGRRSDIKQVIWVGQPRTMVPESVSGGLEKIEVLEEGIRRVGKRASREEYGLQQRPMDPGSTEEPRWYLVQR